MCEAPLTIPTRTTTAAYLIITQVILSGHEYWKRCMGHYVQTTRKHGDYPVYRKVQTASEAQQAETHDCFLYRSTESGKWEVCDDESDIVRNRARIRSAEAAEWPTQSGLRWQYDAGVVMSSFKDDPAIECVERPVTRTLPVRSRLA